MVPPGQGAQFLTGVDAVELGHLHVQQHHRRQTSPERAAGEFAILDLFDRPSVLLQRSPDDPPHDGIVLGDEYRPGRLHRVGFLRHLSPFF